MIAKKRMLSSSNLKKFLCILFFIGILFIIFFIRNRETSISQKIAHLNPLEREYITNFFRYAYFSDGLGWVIFYNKPMSFMTTESGGEQVPEDEDYMHLKHILNKYKNRECCETWERFSSLFEMKNYSIIKKAGRPSIFFINHRTFEKMVNQHIEDFRTVFGSDITSKQILNGFISDEGYVFETIMQHDGLLGTLLGFGRDNAFEYMRRGTGQEMDGFGYIPTSFDSKKILGPFFAVIGGTEETRNLSGTYNSQREPLSKLYQREDFLEIILKKLTSDDPIVRDELETLLESD